MEIRMERSSFSAILSLRIARIPRLCPRRPPLRPHSHRLHHHRNRIRLRPTAASHPLSSPCIQVMGSFLIHSCSPENSNSLLHCTRPMSMIPLQQGELGQKREAVVERREAIGRLAKKTTWSRDRIQTSGSSTLKDGLLLPRMPLRESMERLGGLPLLVAIVAVEGTVPTHHPLSHFQSSLDLPTKERAWTWNSVQEREWECE